MEFGATQKDCQVCLYVVPLDLILFEKDRFDLYLRFQQAGIELGDFAYGNAGLHYQCS